MGYSSLSQCVNELEQTNQLVRIKEEIDPYLEMAIVHRRVQEAGGPAIFYENLKGNTFKAVSNLYGTNKRVDFIFRNEFKSVELLAGLRNDPSALLKNPISALSLAPKALHALPKQVKSSPVLSHRTTLDKLPRIVSWPDDGGAFITLPQVISRDPDKLSIKGTNIGMYRIQMDGNEYQPGKEAGLHYQIHRGIGVHHQKYKSRQQDFKISIQIGGPPAHTVAAILPLPEGFSETIFSGILNGHRYRYIDENGYYINADADFCITGYVNPYELKPEGPFGDHLGYYSLTHPFPFLTIDRVYHKPDAIWHFTVVGRPPAEDSGFGYLIHRLFGDTVTAEFPGLQKVHAVDAAGVHPLLFAIGSERYMPFRETRPEEILTIANHLLGKGQTSLAKYIFITAPESTEVPDIYDIKGFLKFILERLHFDRDLHFITNTTIDTLDYSGQGLNAGSKLILAAFGSPVRKLNTQLPVDLTLPPGYSDLKFFMPGIAVVKGPTYTDKAVGTAQAGVLAQFIQRFHWDGVAFLIVCDDVDFTIANNNNFVWVTFTRSDPANDTYGLNEAFISKHWSIDPPMVLDARIKPHHAPVLADDPDVWRRTDRFFKSGGILEQWG